jgi:hypothetical protein
MINISVDIGPILAVEGVLKGTEAAMKKKKFQSELRAGITEDVPEHFNAFVDVTAGQDARSHWHLYESGMIGNPSGRLFFMRPTTGSNSYLVNYGWEFKPATEPNLMGERAVAMFTNSKLVDIEDTREPQVFRNKAWLVENGATVYMQPRRAKRMAFPNEYGTMIFVKKPIVQDFSQNPGYRAFEEAMNDFTNSQLPGLLEEQADKFERRAGRRLERLVAREARKKKTFVRVGVQMRGALQRAPLSSMQVMDELRRSLDG